MPDADSGTAGKVALELVRTAIAPRLEDICDNLDRVQSVQLENAARVAAIERGLSDLGRECADCRRRTEAALATPLDRLPDRKRLSTPREWLLAVAAACAGIGFLVAAVRGLADLPTCVAVVVKALAK